MSKQELLNFCSEENILLDNGLSDFFGNFENFRLVSSFLKKIKDISGKRFISSSLLYSLRIKIIPFLRTFPDEDKLLIQKIAEKFNLSDKKEEKIDKIQDTTKKDSIIKILSSYSLGGKVFEVKDFLLFFKERYNDFKTVLQYNPELENLIAINRITKDKQKLSLIGMIYNKSTTKNKNIILEVEDLTGIIKVIISKEKEELYLKADNLPLDAVVGIKGFGNRDVLFANDIILPEARLEGGRKKSSEEEYVLFIGDLHYGSKNFIEKDFLKFIDYLNGKMPNTPEVEKIKYLFIIGDLITGVGNYPDQEKDLKILDLEEQFSKIAELLSKIRKDIKIILSPGNHDGVRLMEPQPILNEKFAWALYNLENLIITENPCLVNIGSSDNFEGFNILTYHGFSFPYYANTVPSLMTEKTMNSPEKIMKYLLNYRHLAPTHGSVQYFPLGKDAHFISKIPDIFVSGHTHKSGIVYHNDILLVSVSSWESITPYQEKFGNKPDHCKVPIFNLSTRAIKILDFETLEEEENENRN